MSHQRSIGRRWTEEELDFVRDKIARGWSDHRISGEFPEKYGRSYEAVRKMARKIRRELEGKQGGGPVQKKDKQAPEVYVGARRDNTMISFLYSDVRLVEKDSVGNAAVQFKMDDSEPLHLLESFERFNWLYETWKKTRVA